MRVILAGRPGRGRKGKRDDRSTMFAERELLIGFARSKFRSRGKRPRCGRNARLRIKKRIPRLQGRNLMEKIGRWDLDEPKSCDLKDRGTRGLKAEGPSRVTEKKEFVVRRGWKSELRSLGRNRTAQNLNRGPEKAPSSPRRLGLAHEGPTTQRRHSGHPTGHGRMRGAAGHQILGRGRDGDEHECSRTIRQHDTKSLAS